MPYRKIEEMSNRLLAIQRYIPSDFNRKGRPFNERRNWKATEYRLLLCYTGIYVFKEILDANVYYHFLLLHAAIRKLCSETYDSDEVKNWLDTFVR